jgi:hypothetical protein
MPPRDEIKALRERLEASQDSLKLADALRSAVRALSYYAREENWKEDDWGCKSVIVTPDYAEGGKTARNAIKRIERKLR